MLAQELISNDITPLKLSDSAMLGLSLMEEYKTTHLPIVDKGIFQGLLSESDIYSYNQFEETVGNKWGFYFKNTTYLRSFRNYP